MTKFTESCGECGGVEYKPGKIFHDRTCSNKKVEPPKDKDGLESQPRINRGVTLSTDELTAMRIRAAQWSGGDMEGLGEYIRLQGFLALQVLAAVMSAQGGHRSSNQQRVSAAKAFVGMSSEIVKVADAIEARTARSHRRPAALRLAEKQTTTFPPPQDEDISQIS